MPLLEPAWHFFRVADRFGYDADDVGVLTRTHAGVVAIVTAAVGKRELVGRDIGVADDRVHILLLCVEIVQGRSARTRGRPRTQELVAELEPALRRQRIGYEP